MTGKDANPRTHVYDTLIVGAGFTGLGTAIKLTEAGVEDFVIVCLLYTSPSPRDRS